MTVSNIKEARKRKEPSDPHLAGHAHCLACKFEWVAVAPVGVFCEMECPNCGLQRGVWRGQVMDFGPNAGGYWTCQLCQNDVFVVMYNIGIGCIGCGRIWSFGELAS